ANFLVQKFGYTVSLPSTRETMLAALDHATGELQVRGELNPDDNGPRLDNAINIGLLGGGGAAVYSVEVNGERSEFPINAVTAIKVNSFIGKNSIGIDGLAFSDPLTISTGSADDSIRINVAGMGNGSSVKVFAFGGDDSLDISDAGSVNPAT